jgi:hypothetical protein
MDPPTRHSEWRDLYGWRTLAGDRPSLSDRRLHCGRIRLAGPGPRRASRSSDAIDSIITGVLSDVEHAHVDDDFHLHGIEPIAGLRLGLLWRISAPIGLRLGLGDWIPGGVFVAAEPGLLVAPLASAGYMLLENQITSAGLTLRAARLKAWCRPLSFDVDVNYGGGEISMMVLSHWSVSGAAAGWAGALARDRGRRNSAFRTRLRLSRGACVLSRRGPRRAIFSRRAGGTFLRTLGTGSTMSTVNQDARRSALLPHTPRRNRNRHLPRASSHFPPKDLAAQVSRGGPTHPADAWLDDLKGQHKNIYDCVERREWPARLDVRAQLPHREHRPDLPAQGLRRQRDRLRPTSGRASLASTTRCGPSTSSANRRR